jgi:hypothetical protein
MSRKPKPSGRKGPFDKGRRADAYARRPGQREPKRTIWIVCEAKETEPNYLTSLYNARRPEGVSVKVLRGGGAKALPAKVVERAIDLIDAMKKDKSSWDALRDQAWCVFDTEHAGTPAERENLVKHAEDHEVHVAVSNPAFEYWFLLHLEATDRPFGSAQEVIAALQEHLPDYAKSMDVFSRLDGLTEQALANAKALRERSDRGWEDFPCPSTGADLLVREILGCPDERG